MTGFAELYLQATDEARGRKDEPRLILPLVCRPYFAGSK